MFLPALLIVFRAASLFFSVFNMLCFHCPLLIPFIPCCSSVLIPSLLLSLLQSDSCLCRVTGSSFPTCHRDCPASLRPPFRVQLALPRLSLDATEKTSLRARVWPVTSFISQCAGHLYLHLYVVVKRSYKAQHFTFSSLALQRLFSYLSW